MKQIFSLLLLLVLLATNSHAARRVAVPEGTTGQASCSNDADDNLDGLKDSADSGCSTADQFTASGANYFANFKDALKVGSFSNVADTTSVSGTYSTLGANAHFSSGEMALCGDFTSASYYVWIKFRNYTQEENVVWISTSPIRGSGLPPNNTDGHVFANDSVISAFTWDAVGASVSGFGGTKTNGTARRQISLNGKQCLYFASNGQIDLDRIVLTPDATLDPATVSGGQTPTVNYTILEKGGVTITDQNSAAWSEVPLWISTTNYKLKMIWETGVTDFVHVYCEATDTERVNTATGQDSSTIWNQDDYCEARWKNGITPDFDANTFYAAISAAATPAWYDASWPSGKISSATDLSVTNRSSSYSGGVWKTYFRANVGFAVTDNQLSACNAALADKDTGAWSWVFAHGTTGNSLAGICQFSTTTVPAPPTDTTPPTVTSPAATNIGTDRADITASTNEAGTGKVRYGTSTGVYTVTSSTVTCTASCSVNITGLTANTQYFFVVDVTDAAGNTGTSAEANFTTASTTTKFVATTGNDTTGDGSSGNPWATPQKCSDNATAGITCSIAAGTYAKFTVTNSGTPTSRITFTGAGATTIIDGSVVESTWVAAPEIGSGVFKKTLGYEPGEINIDGKSVWRINSNWMDDTRGPAALARSATATRTYASTAVNAWDGIDALWGYLSGVTYIRLRAGEDPDTHTVRVSAGLTGAAITATGKSNITIKDLAVRGARNGIALKSGSNNNIIQDVTASGGNTRILLDGSSQNLITGLTGTINSYGFDTYKPGAWATSSIYASAVAQQIHDVNKNDVGDTVEDDWMVRQINGANFNTVEDSTFTDGIVAVGFRNATGGIVRGNTMTNIGSEGIWLHIPSTDITIADNTFSNNNFGIRLQGLETGPRRYWIYKNRFWGASYADAFYFHVFPSTAISGARPEIYIYHNSFAGADCLSMSTALDDKQGLVDSLFVNNVYSCPSLFTNASGTDLNNMAVQGFDWNFFRGTQTSRSWFGPNNITGSSTAVWAEASLPVSFSLPVGHAARDAGIDVSRPFTVQGVTYQPLPGFTPGYFTGLKPDMGAVED